MALVIKDRVKQTCSAPTTTNPFDFTGASTTTGFQTFVAALADGDTCLYVASDASGNWETGLGTWTEASDELARTTILASSNSGSAETFSGDVTVAITQPARDVQSAALDSRGLIRGLDITYSSTTAIAVAAGTAAINGKILTYAGATLTSGSTMKDIANSTVTIGASKCYFVFLYDNAGSAEIRIEERDGTGDGADPTFDTDLDYWKAASTGGAARRIGKFWTDASSLIIKFWFGYFGRRTVCNVENVAGLLLLSGGTSTSYANITTTPYMTADDESIKVGLAITRSSGTSTCVANISIDNGSTYVAAIATNAPSGASEVRLRPVTIPYRGDLDYVVSGTAAALTIILLGFECTR